MTKAQLEALVNGFLAPSQPITANGQHKPSMQKIIDEMYDPQSRANILSAIQVALSLADGDKVFLIRGNQAHLVDVGLLTGEIVISPDVDGGTP